MLPLHIAAGMAYQRVFGRQHDRAPSNDELDLVALALSMYLPIYGVRTGGRRATRISEAELMEGMFWGGAARFESRHRPGATAELAVDREELERVLRELKP